MSKNDNVVLSCLGMWTGIIIAIVGGAIMSGWVLSILWSWFVIPIFNLPNISISMAIGFSLVVGMLTSHSAISNNNNGKETWEIILQLLGKALGEPLLFLIIGWIVKMFVH